MQGDILAVYRAVFAVYGVFTADWDNTRDFVMHTVNHYSILTFYIIGNRNDYGQKAIEAVDS